MRQTLRAYVREELEVIRETAPDVVVGDFRLSLAVSTRLTKTPYLAITNAYWSPYGRQSFPMPELHVASHLGLAIARTLFQIARPFAFAYHTLPLNRVRREYGLPSLGFDLRRIYTEADHTLYADVPEMVPTFDRPANHHYLGPILWSPAVELPDWWHDIPGDRPVVYVNLGSSGPNQIALPPSWTLSRTFRFPSLRRPLAVVVRSLRSANVRLADVLPGEHAAARADLVICNGGSPTTHQALAEGTPVLGLASNMDQHLNMAGVQRLARESSSAPRVPRRVPFAPPCFRCSKSHLMQELQLESRGCSPRMMPPIDSKKSWRFFEHREAAAIESVPAGQTLLMTAMDRARARGVHCTLHRRPGTGAERAVIVCSFEPRRGQDCPHHVYRQAGMTKR